MMTFESGHSHPGAVPPQPIGEIEYAIERSTPATPDPAPGERPAVKPIGEIESAIERSRKQA